MPDPAHIRSLRAKSSSVLSSRLVIRSVLLLMVTMVCTLMLELYFTSQDRAQESRDDLVRRLNSIEPNIVQALWRLDPDTIRVAVRSIGNGPGVVSVSVRAQFRINDINETYAIPNAKQYPCTEEFLRDYSSYIVEGLEIGSGLLKVCYSDAVLPSGYMMHRVFENLVRTFSVTVIMALLLFWLIDRSVINPINQLITMVRSNTLAEGSQLERLRIDRDDEIDELCAEMTERARVVELTHRDDKLRVLGMLASGVAHDFNNLLAVISSSADLIKSNSGDPKVTHEMSDAIIQAALSGYALTRRMSILSNQQKRSTALVDLEDVFDHIKTFADILLKGGVRIKLSAEPDINIRVDSGGLEASLLNLIMNARDAIKGIPDGEISVEGKQILVEGVRSVAISVTDNGIGIPKENLTKVTEPFFTTKDKSKGSGLGLAMADVYATCNGGSLKITSSENSGTCVTITLPTEEAPKADIDVVPLRPKTAPKPPQAENSTIKVFVLDDEPNLAKTLAMTLKTLDYKCDSSDNAIDVLNDAEKLGGYDVFVCDVLLGPITGPELYEQLKSILKERCPKVIFISGALPESASDFMNEVTIKNVLIKPFVTETLDKAIQDVLTPRSELVG